MFSPNVLPTKTDIWEADIWEDYLEAPMAPCSHDIPSNSIMKDDN